MEMNGEVGNEEGSTNWRFRPNGVLAGASKSSIRGVLMRIKAELRASDSRPVIPLGHGDPSVFDCFRTSIDAEDAVAGALRSAEFNCYASNVGLPSARCAVAEYLSRDLPYKLSSNDVFLAAGCTQSIEAVLAVLACPNANILLPSPGFPFYEARAAFSGLEARHFSLLPERGWEIDLQEVESLADENTVAIVVINPGNPCGNVFTYDHLSRIAETAKRLGILIIADEVYGHLAFGSNPFIPMGVFGHLVPVLTVGGLSKRWLVPGWRLGWIAATDPNGVLRQTKIIDGIENFLNISTDPATFVQGAVPRILENTKDDFFNKTIGMLRQAADLCFDTIKDLDCIVCPHKPQGSMFVMVKLDLAYLEDINDEFDFCSQLAKEESVIILPGKAVGMEGWLRITFAVDTSFLQDGLTRLKSFCQRHAKRIK